MPVIGRLDEQVDEVLIRPASRRGRARDADGRAPSESGEELTRTTPAPDSKSPAPASGDATGRDAEPRAREELPVWLL